MTQLEEQLHTLRDIRLPEDARLRMRDNLLAYADLHQVQSRAVIHSPFSILGMQVYTGLAAVLIILISLGGTAYASEGALPGDTLYSVKVGVTEPLQTALIPSDQGRAAWHAILAERRLEETAQLAAKGTLSPSAQASLAANFNSQVSASQESAKRLQRAGDMSGSLSAQSDLEARLSAHARILSVIAAHYALATSTDGQSTHVALEHMLALVTDHTKSVILDRIALENAIQPVQNAQGSATAKVAVATTPRSTHTQHELAIAPAAQVQTAAGMRTEEEAHILDRHAVFLAKFLPLATTSATTTATTTQAATSTSPEENLEK